jgi:3-oxoacyl-[acyl-carrier protein] reductase
MDPIVETQETRQGSKNLSGKVAVVSGGSRGIGEAIVRQLAACGANVVFTYNKNKALAEKTVSEISQDNSSKVIAAPCSLQDSRTIQSVVDLAIENFDKVDILVNNAGIIRDGLFMGMDEASWNEVISTNLGGTYFFTKAVCEHMVFQKYGRIINISSVVSQIGGIGQANYAASKGAINSFSKALATELAGKGVTVNAVAPGMIETEMIENVKGLAGDLTKRIPCGRYGKPSEIAALVAFLASEEAGYINGQVITIDGGLSLQSRR